MEAKEAVESPEEAATAESGGPRPPRVGVDCHRSGARSSPTQLFGLTERSSAAGPFAGGSTEDQVPGTHRGCGCSGPTRAGVGYATPPCSEEVPCAAAFRHKTQS